NTGNVHGVVSGNIFIYRGDEQIDTLEVNPLKGNTLPNSARQFDTDWKSGFPFYDSKKDQDGNPIYDQNSQPEYELKWDYKNVDTLRFGKYTANMVLAYDDGNRDIPIV